MISKTEVRATKFLRCRCVPKVAPWGLCSPGEILGDSPLRGE